MSPSDKVNQQTKKEWRELGFYYDFNDKTSSWQIVGSRKGLLKFCKLLEDYASDEKYRGLSEHEHYGPYSYLKFMTWKGAEITEKAICGTQEDFRNLARLVRDKLFFANVNDSFMISVEYAKDSNVSIDFQIKQNKFDPASADIQLNDLSVPKIPERQ